MQGPLNAIYVLLKKKEKIQWKSVRKLEPLKILIYSA